MSNASIPTFGRIFIWRVLLVTLVLACDVLPMTSNLIRAADDEQETAEERQEFLPPDPNRITEKQVKAYAGLVALAGIVIIGIALVGLIIVWAGRLRRQLRRPLPSAEYPDRDFWFLKPPKPTVTNSSLPDSHQPPHDPTPIP